MKTKNTSPLYSIDKWESKNEFWSIQEMVGSSKKINAEFSFESVIIYYLIMYLNQLLLGYSTGVLNRGEILLQWGISVFQVGN